MAPEPEPATTSQSQAPEQAPSQPQAEVETQQQQQQQPEQQRRGPRAARFQTTLDSALSHTLGKISWDNFAACYPTMAAKAPAVLRAVQSQMVERLRALCQKEFDSIQQARDVVAKLNELEALVADADRRRREAGGAEAPVPPHMLPPEDVLDAHLAPHLAQQRSQLNAKLQTVQAHNANLFDDVRRQRSEIEDLVAVLEKVVGDVEDASRMMMMTDGGSGSVANVDALAKETRSIEVEMAGL